MTREEAIKLLVNATYSDEWQGNEDLTTAHNMAIKALETVEEFEKAHIITGGRLNGRTYAYKCGLEDGKRKALEQESCEDAISRKEVKEVLRNRIGESISDCINSLSSVTPIQRWIFVSEELPKSDEDVLVTNGKGMYIGWIDPTDKRWRVDSESEYYMENVVAWMPLPKLYKKGTDV